MIPASAQARPIVTPNPGLQFTDERGNLTNVGRIALQQLRDYVVNMSRTMPCNASTDTNVITLTLLPIQPLVSQYVSYETFAFVADTDSTGDLSALVVTAEGTLATLNVYKDNGATQAASGDVVKDCQYFATYVDSLDSGNGGFVLR